MFWIEIKKNTFSIIFLLAVILLAGFTFFLVFPEIEYYYSKPLSSGEYTYFKLKEDMRGSSLLVYGGEEGNGIPADLEITEEIRNKIRNILDEGKNVYDGSKEELIVRSRGKVWELKVSEVEAINFENKYLVSKKNLLEDGVRLRVISNDKPTGGAREAMLALNDVYLNLVG